MTETENQNKEVQNTTHSDCKNGLKKTKWTNDEKKALAAFCFPLIEMQNQYGQQRDPKVLLKGWELKLAKRFTVEQILYAVDKYTDSNDDFPTVSDVINILEPQEPQVTEAQFVEAQKCQERNNWPMMSDAQDTIDRYRRQQEEKREKFEIESEEIKQIVNNSVKKISN